MMQGAKQMDMTFVAPRFMQVGGGSVGRIADLLAKLGLSRPLLVTDPFMVSSGLVQHCKAYERLAVQAAMSGSRETTIRALVANPLVGQYPVAEQLTDALLETNRRFLTRFFPEG